MKVYVCTLLSPEGQTTVGAFSTKRKMKKVLQKVSDEIKTSLFENIDYEVSEYTIDKSLV